MKFSYNNINAVVILALVVVFFYCTFPAGLYFLADDFIHVPQSSTNVLLQQNALRLTGNFTLWLNYQWFGSTALGYHITNALLHLACTVLVYKTAQSIFSFLKGQAVQFVSTITALLFLVYPYHSESLYWIIGRSGSLGAVFFLLAWLPMLQENISLKDFILSLLFFQIGLLAYESCWVFPIIIKLTFWYKQQNTRQHKFYTSAFFFLLFINIFSRKSLTGEFFNAYDANHFLHFNIPQLAINAAKLIGRSFVPPAFSATTFVVGCFITFIIVTLLFISYSRRSIDQRRFFFLLFCWLISYLPYLSIGIDTHGSEGERYLYLPSVFLLILFVYLLYNTVSYKFILPLVVLLSTFSLYYLYQSKKNYQHASSITKQTLAALSQQQNKKLIFVENLPQYNHGAVIFRTGLTPATNWLMPSITPKIIVVSIDSSDVTPTPIKENIFNTNLQKVQASRQVAYVMNYINSKGYVISDTSNLYFNSPKHAWLRFSNNLLTVEY